MHRTWKRIRLGGALAALIALAAPVAAEELVTDKLGKKIEAVTFSGFDGQAIALASAQGKKATVVVFLSFECPVSNSYAPSLGELAKKYASQDVAFVGVVAGDEKPEAVRKQADEFKFGFPVYLDPKLAAVEAFKATHTPEAFVLDHNAVLRYRGRIDNSWYARLKKNQQVTEHDLRNALDELLAGKAVRTPATKAIGCPVVTKADVEQSVTTKVSFYKDVLPILQNNCQSCHRPGEVGPFSLVSYKQAVNWAEDIKEYTASRKMPPWKPVEGPAMHAERTLTDAQIKTLSAWADGGTPEGDPKDAPPAKEFPPGWRLGKPDLVLEPKEDFHLGASGPDTFRCFVLPTGLTEDRYIIGYDIRPGNPRVVHHTLNFWDLTGNARKLEDETRTKAKDTDQDHGPGYSVAMGLGFIPVDRTKIGGFGGWAPGSMYRFLPEESGYLLPRGADIVIQTHYHRDGRPEKDRLQVALYFADKPVKKRWQNVVVDGFPLFSMIPAGKEDHVAKGSMWVETDCTVHSVMPHMHLLGKAVKITMTPPEGETKTLVRIADWDYNWQETYWLKEPIAVKAGTRFDIEAVFDNSSKNPNNPSNPPKPVWRGEETTNEMLFGFIGAVNEDGLRIRMSRTPPKKAGDTVKPEAKK